jgi:hypothetical protein
MRTHAPVLISAAVWDKGVAAVDSTEDFQGAIAAIIDTQRLFAVSNGN